MESRFFELRVSQTGRLGKYNLFGASSVCGEGETLSAIIEPEALPFETLSSLLDQPQTLQDLRTLGTALFESLFSGKAGRVFQSTLDEVLLSDDRTLRMVLRIEPPELAVLPWEILFDPHRQLFLGATPQISLSRTLSIYRLIRSMILPPEARALVVVPNSGLDVNPERSQIERLLRQVMAVDGVPGKVTLTRLRTALQERAYHLVHFSGHGVVYDGEALIFLDSEKSVLDPVDRVPAMAFADLFQGYPEIRLVLLNSCQGAMISYEALTGVAPELLRRGVPAVIAMQSSITNSEATLFASAFYQALIRGTPSGSIDAALARARGALLQEGFDSPDLVSPVFASPVLYLRSQEGRLWHPGVPDLPGVWTAVQNHAARVRKNLDPFTLQRVSRSEFQARRLPLLRKSIEERQGRIVAILGAAGYGKSTLLGEIYDSLQAEGVPWILLMDCGELDSAPGEDLDVAMGRAVGGGAEPITQLASGMARKKGPGVVMIDTLDLVLHPRFAPHFQRVLSSLGEAGVTVIFTCRDHDYEMVLGPADRLKQIGGRIDPYRIPPFQSGEIEQAARAFIDEKVGATGSLEGEIFAEKILSLSADSRPLRQITASPLLLAMLCDLFGKEKDLPRDLTVSQLYERYWKEKVANSRIFGPEDHELIEKPRLCLQIAEKLFERSAEHLQESIQQADLDLTGAGRAGATNELLSAAVLKRDLLDSLRFFHQTFLEFTIARWLTTRAGETARTRMLAALGQSRGNEAPLYWWPVLRQFLVMVQEKEFLDITGNLALGSPAAFRTVSLAAAIRRDRPLLQHLLEHALSRGSEHQGYLCFAVENAPALEPDLAWQIVIEILRNGPTKGALAAIQTAVALLGAPDANLAKRLREVLDAIDERYRRDRDHVEKAEIQGQLFQGSRPFLEERGPREPAVFDLLEGRYPSLIQRIRCVVVRLFATAPLAAERKVQFLETLFGHPADGEVGEEIIGLFLLRLQAESAATKELPGEKIAVLHAGVPQKWEGFHANSVGRLYGGDPGFIAALLQDLFSPPCRMRYRNLMALQEVLRGGHADLVCTALVAVPQEAIPREALRELADIVRAISNDSDDVCRQKVAEWLPPLVRRWPEETVSLYSAVADVSEPAWELLITTLDDLMAAGRTKSLKSAVQAVRPAATPRLAPQIERFAQLDSARSIYKQMLVELYSSITHRPEAVLRLRDLSLDKEREIAVTAAHSLVEAAAKGEHPEIPELLPLLGSTVPAVRESCFDALLAIQKGRTGKVSTQTLCELAGVAGRDTYPAVVQRFCKLLQEEIRRGADLPREVVEVVTGLADDLGGTRGLGQKVARALIRVYKLIAQREIAEWGPILEQAMLRFLEEIDTNMLSRGEMETINLISALVRVDPGVLSRLVEHGPHFKPRNVRPLAIAIQRTEGKGSPLLAQVLAAEWCPPDARKVILQEN